MNTNTISIKEISDQLLSLKKSGVVGIKQSFEDEGVILDDVLKLKDSVTIRIRFKPKLADVKQSQI